MKRYFKLISIACILLLSCTTAFARESFDFAWEGNYTDMTLDITIKSPVNYTQSVSVVMYPSELENPSVANYSRMLQAELTGGKDKTVSIKLGDDLYTQSGRYTVVVQGNGYENAISRMSDSEVYIKTPSQIYGDSGLIYEFNNAIADNLSAVLSKVEKALDLSIAESGTESDRYNAFLGIKQQDFSNAFATLDDVKKAWECSDIIVCIAAADSTSHQLAQMVEACSDMLNVNTDGEEYAEHKEQLYSKMLKIGKALNTTGVKCCSDIQTAFAQAQAIVAVNNAQLSALEAVIKANAAVLGISDEYIEKFDSINDSNKKAVVTRQLYNKDFSYPSEAAAEFTEAVDNVTGGEEDNNSSGGGSSNSGSGSSSGGGSGGSSGGSVGGGSTGLGAVDISSPYNTAVSAFADCDTNHWAYAYVNKLKQSNVVSGYENGMFYPDRHVTREEFVKMIISATGLYNSSAACNFSDVQGGAWYYQYIASAVQSDIVSGISDSEFGLGQNITREDTAVIAARILSRFSKYPADTSAKDFADADSISSYAKESVDALAELNIISGYEDNSFRPKSNLTRAQAAKIISMIVELI
ncbi:MAG: S-layer homology domain-containing protein [Clostridia bacterium]|nr:S-layer homology domain-containing protein [Clostridia bacterium]